MSWRSGASVAGGHGDSGSSCVVGEVVGWMPPACPPVTARADACPRRADRSMRGAPVGRIASLAAAASAARNKGRSCGFSVARRVPLPVSLFPL